MKNDPLDYRLHSRMVRTIPYCKGIGVYSVLRTEGVDHCRLTTVCVEESYTQHAASTASAATVANHDLLVNVDNSGRERE